MKLCECGCGEPTKIAKLTDRRRGHVAGESMPFLHGHGGGFRGSQYKVDPETGCWVWQWRRNAKGYGAFRDTLAHKVFWERENGPVPDGFELDHRCCNPPCVNPAHLEPVTHLENVRRGRRTKLSATDIAAIAASTESNAELGRRYGVHGSTIRRARDRA